MLATRACGKQTYLGFLDSVLGLAALAIQVVVSRLRLTREVGDHVARVVTLLAIFESRDHPALFGLALCSVHELADLALLSLRGCKFLFHCQFQEFGDALQARVTSQTNDVVHTGALTVVDDALTAKA